MSIAAKLILIRSWYIFILNHSNCKTLGRLQIWSLKSSRIRENARLITRYHGAYIARDFVYARDVIRHMHLVA